MSAGALGCGANRPQDERPMMLPVAVVAEREHVTRPFEAEALIGPVMDFERLGRGAELAGVIGCFECERPDALPMRSSAALGLNR